MIPRLIPSNVSDTNRHKRPWSDTSRSKLVEIQTLGEEKQGIIRVPNRLVRTIEHSNERLEFNKLVRENIQRWAEWRGRRGWAISSKPKVKGPYAPPQGSAKAKQFNAKAEKVIGHTTGHMVDEFDSGEELQWYIVTAKFTRTAPLYTRLEDVLMLRDLHRTYGEPFSHERIASQRDESDSGWVDPMAYAAARRNRLGLKREDYLIGDIRDPL